MPGCHIHGEVPLLRQPHLKLVEECVGLLKQVEGVNEDDFDSAIVQEAQTGEQIEDDDVPSNESARERRVPEVLGGSPEGLKCMVLGSHMPLIRTDSEYQRCTELHSVK